MELKIEKNVPISDKYKPTPRGALILTLGAMDVGDSFLWPKVKRNHLSAYYVRFPGKKFASRSVDEENVRVWRVA
jgi:hypothetical protein